MLGLHRHISQLHHRVVGFFFIQDTIRTLSLSAYQSCWTTQQDSHPLSLYVPRAWEQERLIRGGRMHPAARYYTSYPCKTVLHCNGKCFVFATATGLNILIWSNALFVMLKLDKSWSLAGMDGEILIVSGHGHVVCVVLRNLQRHSPFGLARRPVSLTVDRVIINPFPTPSFKYV